MKVLKLNSISPIVEDFFRGYEYSDCVEDPEGIIVRSQSMHEYKERQNLLAIARAGAGVNNIPVDKYTEKGIVVFNTPGANANAVKELVICELFLGGRKIMEASDWVQSLKGQEGVAKLVEKGKSQFVGQEVLGKKLGVIGLGAIGAMVANTAIDLGMSVVGYDPFLSVKSAWMINNRVVFTGDIVDIFRDCDYISVHVPLNAETKGMFNKNTLSICKDGVVIINNARGELVADDDMVEAVKSGKVSRYITDFPNEKLLDVENILCVPHLGASTPEAEENCAYMAARQLRDYLDNGNITNSVNYPDVSMPRTSISRICIHHYNVKEMLSKILSIVSGSGLNIAHMLDQSKGEFAYLILELDDYPTQTTIDMLESLEGVIRVRALTD